MRKGRTVKFRKPFAFWDKRALVRVYRDIFMILDIKTRDWALARIVVLQASTTYAAGFLDLLSKFEDTPLPQSYDTKELINARTSFEWAKQEEECTRKVLEDVKKNEEEAVQEQLYAGLLTPGIWVSKGKDTWFKTYKSARRGRECCGRCESEEERGGIENGRDFGRGKRNKSQTAES